MKIIEIENIIILQDNDKIICKSEDKKLIEIKCDNGVLFINNISYKKFKGLVMEQDQLEKLKNYINKNVNVQTSIKTMKNNKNKICTNNKNIMIES